MRFGEVAFRSSAPNHGKVRFLRPLPHAGDKCSCFACDQIRIDNGMARVSINWPRDYPPLFYKNNPPEEEWFGPRAEEALEANSIQVEEQEALECAV